MPPLALLRMIRTVLDSRTVARAYRLAFLCFIYIVVASIVLNIFMTRWGFHYSDKPFGFTVMMSYEADRPWAYRVLMPLAVNGASALVPDRLLELQQEKWLETSRLLTYEDEQIDGNINWNLRTSLKYHLTYMFVYLSLIIFLLTMRRLSVEFFAPLPLARDLGPPLILLVLLPLTFRLGGYMYDFPELMFMGLCLLALVKSQWLWFYLLLPLAVANKESSILLVLFFVALKFRYMSFRPFATHLVAQAVLVGGVFLATRWIFADNPGVPAEDRLTANVEFMLKPSAYVQFFQPFGALIYCPRGFNIISLLFLAWAVFRRWGERPPALKRLLVITSVVLFPLYLRHGSLDEIRALSLMFPALYLLIFESVFIGYGQGEAPLQASNAC